MKKIKTSDIVISLIIVAMVLMIVIPMPTFMVDILLSANIALSLLIFLLAMFNSYALDFSVYPSLLLITTIFRVALNITTTRYILLYADAGQVINAFGNFVMGGNMIVGFIVFIIIQLVNFMVITKGSERVAEVTARFTLDAMPGKQMAIDADLNAGMIDEQTARQRRENIQREADFYGSMDGATKFVKGDAVASIVITTINLLAGILVGILYHNMTAMESLQRYALLSVGDGIVSSISSLLISVATGLIVTRAASENNLGSELRDQLFSDGMLMFIMSGLLFVLALTPLPTLPNLGLSIVFLIVGLSIRNASTKTEEAAAEAAAQASGAEDEIEAIRRPENVLPLLNVEAIELEFGYGIIPLADKSQGGDLFDRLVMIRRQCAMEMGIIVPMIRLRDNIQLEANEYIIKIKGVEVGGGSVLFDHYLAMNPGNAQGEITGIDTIEPAFGLPAKWIDENEREKAEIYGYTVVDPPSMIATHLTNVIKKYAHELLTRQDTQTLLDNLKESQPTLVGEVVPNLLSVGEVQKVLSNLLREGVSIRNLASIIEALADYATMTKDTDMLTEYVRQSMYRSITDQYMHAGTETKVITVDPDVEKSIMDSLQTTETGTYMALDPETSKRLVKSVSDEVEKVVSAGQQPILVTAPIVRFYLKKFVDQISEEIVVLSYNEIDRHAKIKSIGVVSV